MKLHTVGLHTIREGEGEVNILMKISLPNLVYKYPTEQISRQNYQMQFLFFCAGFVQYSYAIVN